MHHAIDRRSFLGFSSACAALGAWGALSPRALAQRGGSGYKALVCVLLEGGNDSLNMLVPRSGASYADYAAARAGLALDPATLLPISPLTAPPDPYGLHPAMSPLDAHFTAGRLAFVANAGPLVQPLDKATYLAGTAPVPAQLFSHSDQRTQWNSAHADGTFDTGWGGRVAEYVAPLNGGAALSPAISLSGTNLFQAGQGVQPYFMGVAGPTLLAGYDDADGPRRRQALEAILNASHEHAFAQELAQRQLEAIALGEAIDAALGSAASLTTLFPDEPVANALKMVARTIQIRAALGHARQVFFVNFPGWDMHADLLPLHAPHLATLAAALDAFQAALGELGVASDVVTFTMSDFGRALGANGSEGSDHGWGGHALVLGESVLGGEIYGTLPSLAIGGPDDVGGGRLLPTTSVEQYAATLARWFGVADPDLDTLFPNLASFASSDLGFL